MAQEHDGVAEGDHRRRGVHGDGEGRARRGRGPRLHAEGGCDKPPSNATPIDFAYHVHTEVGHRTIGAKVNGRIVPLDSELVSGDRVEVITASQRARAATGWPSSRAGAPVTRSGSSSTRPTGRTTSTGREKVGLKKQRIGKVPPESWKTSPASRTTRRRTTCSPPSAPGSSRRERRTPHRRARPAQGRRGPARSPALTPLPLPEAETGTGEETGVRVVGSSGILTRLARCCTPMPGDDIVGYVSLGRGVVVHAKGCTNARALRARDPERFVEVEWAASNGKLHRGAPRRGAGQDTPAERHNQDDLRRRREHPLGARGHHR